MTTITICVQHKEDAIRILSHLMDLSTGDFENDFYVNMTDEERPWRGPLLLGRGPFLVERRRQR
jgi:hypothetical protein